jgi:hypothetical protein
MSAIDASRIVIDDSRVTVQNVASLIGDSIGVLYNHNVLIIQATNHQIASTNIQNSW